MSLISHSAKRFVTIHGCTENQAQHASGFFVHHFHRYFSFTNHLQVVLGQEVIVITEFRLRSQAVGIRAHFYIKSIHGCFVRIVCSSPVGNYTSVESPLSFQDIIIQQFAMSGVHTTHLIICTHNTPYTATLHSRFKCRKINFIQGTVGQLHINIASPFFLIIQGVMFNTSRHTVFLHFLNIRNTHFGSQIRVFA